MITHEPDFNSNGKLIGMSIVRVRPLINILIRSSYRPYSFARCIESVACQTYKNIRVIVSYDNPRALTYIPSWCETIPVTPYVGEYGYNLYCNDLKAQVTDGYYFFLDDDDRFASPSALEELVNAMDADHHIYLVNFARGSVLKPGSNKVERGKIGMPCIVVDAGLKDAAQMGDTMDADYLYIREMTSRYRYKYLNLTLVKSPRRGFGFKED